MGSRGIGPRSVPFCPFLLEKEPGKSIAFSRRSKSFSFYHEVQVAQKKKLSG